jgi:hypothetical protein
VSGTTQEKKATHSKIPSLTLCPTIKCRKLRKNWTLPPRLHSSSRHGAQLFNTRISSTIAQVDLEVTPYTWVQSVSLISSRLVAQCTCRVKLHCSGKGTQISGQFASVVPLRQVPSSRFGHRSDLALHERQDAETSQHGSAATQFWWYAVYSILCRFRVQAFGITDLPAGNPEEIIYPINRLRIKPGASGQEP